jgi:hypothetical protein
VKFPDRPRELVVINLKNIPGWRTSRKMVVFECDDWGGIRMPSREAYGQLVSAGVPMTDDRFTKFDTLAGVEDLEHLFNALRSVSDFKGRPAVMTAVTNVANPDFQKIRESDFQRYFYEKFTDTLIRYGRGEEVLERWKEGVQAGIFVPELHGREHLTVQIWLRHLREGNRDLLCAFDHGFVALKAGDAPAPAGRFRAEFYFDSEEQKPFLMNSVREGVLLFKEIFGHSPRMFVPSNLIFHHDFEAALAGSGVKFLNVSHRTPYPDAKGGLRYRHFITGQKSRTGLVYYTRNCAFEPTGETYRGIDLTMRQIAAAFRWGKPANISTHRVNFVGGISPGNRAKGLTELNRLLKAIKKRWPDVEFMSSADALEIMNGSKGR